MAVIHCLPKNVTTYSKKFQMVYPNFSPASTLHKHSLYSPRLFKPTFPNFPPKKRVDPSPQENEGFMLMAQSTTNNSLNFPTHAAYI